MSAKTNVEIIYRHRLPIRIMHWTNAVAMIIMIGSGWKIYAMFDGSGNRDPKTGVTNVPAPFDWELRMRIVCAKV